jgi:hypothetical protein
MIDVNRGGRRTCDCCVRPHKGRPCGAVVVGSAPTRYGRGDRRRSMKLAAVGWDPGDATLDPSIRLLRQLRGSRRDRPACSMRLSPRKGRRPAGSAVGRACHSPRTRSDRVPVRPKGIISTRTQRPVRHKPASHRAKAHGHPGQRQGVRLRRAAPVPVQRTMADVAPRGPRP